VAVIKAYMGFFKRLLYADDIILLSPTVSGLQKIMFNLSRATSVSLSLLF
jgi:hypothetical protein